MKVGIGANPHRSLVSPRSERGAVEPSVMVIAAGLVVGVGLVFLGWTGGDDGRIVLCTGLGIVLAALGTTARVEHRRYTVTGGGAIALVFYAMLQYHAPLDSKAGITWGLLKPKTGEFKKPVEIKVKDLQYLPGAMDLDFRAFHFVLPKDRVRSSELELTINEDGSGSIPFRIDRQYIDEYEKTGKRLELRYDRDEATILDRRTRRVVARFPESDEMPPLARSDWFPSLVPSAHAESSTSEELIRGLKGSTLRERIDSREAILKEGPPAVQALAAQLRVEPAGPSRFDLVNTLYEILRGESSNRSAMSAALGPSDLAVVAEMLGDSDRNARRLATAFLMALHDADAVAPLVEVVRDGKSAEHRYNAALVLESYLGEVETTRGNEVVEVVHAAAAADDDPVRKKVLKDFGTPRFYVVLRSFAAEDDAVEQAQELAARNDLASVGVYRLNSGRFVTAAGKFTLGEARGIKSMVVRESAAATDAWLTPGTVFRERVYPR